MHSDILQRTLREARRTPIIAVLCNLAIAYAVYMLTRVIYFAVNHSYFVSNLTTGRALEMLNGGLVFDTSAIMYTCAVYILLMLLPLPRKETPAFHKAMRWLFVVLIGLAVAMNLADSVYFRYTTRRTTATVFSEFSGEDNLLSIFAVEMVRNWYLVLAAAAIIWAVYKLYVTPRLERHTLKRAPYFIVQCVSLAVMIPLAVAGMRGGVSHSTRPITISNANQYVERPTETALVLNTPFSILRTLGKDVFENPRYFADTTEVDAIYSPVHQPDTASVFTPKNVVVFIVESFGKEYVGSLNRDLDGGTYKGYTPFIDSLLTRSLTFENSFANGHKSIDAMPSILSGIPMMREPFFLTSASLNDISGLASLLAPKGYQSAFFHGANNGSMGFQAYARDIGYDQYLGRTEYDADPHFGGDKDYDGIWAIWDEPFLQFMLSKLNSFRQPFLATVFTASSHHPFKVPEQYADSLKDEGGQPIHKCIRYTDMALRRFFEGAARQPWYANTLFVIVADHTNQSTHEFYKNDLGTYSVPILFFTPDGSVAPGVDRERIAQQADIMPTILGFLGYDKPYLAFGNDLTRTEPADTWAFNYNNGVYQYIKGDFMLQFDGTATKALYDFRRDPLLRNNLAGKVSQQAAMERELKAFIQQYITRMNENRLLP